MYHTMLVRRSPISSASDYTDALSITRVWANDGWCYIPELKKRQQFFDTEEGTLLKSESYDGIIPLPLYSECVLYATFPKEPRSWVEMGNGWAELYEMLSPSHSK